jgi:GTP-binding protein
MADERTDIEVPDDEALDEEHDEDLLPEPDPAPPLLGTVAIVGFPNVGKSTLVNRLSGTRQAVVHETSGVTRDRKELVVEWTGRRFLLIDTGGVDIADETPITRSIAVQAREAVAEADLVLFVVDAQIGITPGDEEVAQILREAKKPVLVIANKIDDPRMEPLALELHALGLGDPIPISGLHGHGAGDLLDEILDYLEAHATQGREEIPDEAIRVAILGRPNVGKSTLLNKLVGRERVIVSEIPGTTRDSIDTVLERGGRTFVLIDTAGLRRKRRHRQGIEYYSELRALESAERADVALVLIDAAEGVVDQDLAVADVARKADNSTLIVLSKWDVTTVRIEDVRAMLRRRLRQRPPFLAISAHTGRGLDRLLDTVVDLFDRHIARIPTPELNDFLQELRNRRQPPARRGKRLNLLYGTQTQTRPPRIRIFVNDPTLVTRDYGYWVENEIRERFGLDGVPVSIDFARRT